MSEIPQPSIPPRRKMFPTMMILTIIAALGIVVWFNYYIKVTNDMKKGRLAMRGRVETDPGNWVDRDGKPRKLEDLKGKVVVWSYLYTTCPSGCAGVADKMKELQDEFGSNPKFHLVSVSLYPEHDRPENLKAWAEAKGFGGDNWWFLTSAGPSEQEGDTIRKWMQKSFGMWAKKKDEAHIKEFPADVWDHNLVMTASDPNGNVRAPTNNDAFWVPFHQAFDNSWAPRPMREDIKKLLDEAENN